MVLGISAYNSLRPETTALPPARNFTSLAAQAQFYQTQAKLAPSAKLKNESQMRTEDHPSPDFAACELEFLARNENLLPCHQKLRSRLNTQEPLEREVSEAALNLCQRGFYVACKQLVREASRIDSVSRTRISSNLQKLCHEDIIGTCSLLGRWYWDQGQEAEKIQARTLLQSQCDNEDPYSCFELAVLDREKISLGVYQTRGDPRENLMRACRFGPLEFCQLAMEADSEAVFSHTVLGRLEKECQRNSTLACHLSGEIYAKRGEHKAALQPFSLACRKADGTPSCWAAVRSVVELRDWNRLPEITRFLQGTSPPKPALRKQLKALEEQIRKLGPSEKKLFAVKDLAIELSHWPNWQDRSPAAARETEARDLPAESDWFRLFPPAPSPYRKPTLHQEHNQ